MVHRNPNSFVQLRDLATTRDDDHFGDRLKMLRWWPSTRPWTHRCTLQRTRQTREPWQTGALKYTKASLSALSPIKKKTLVHISNCELKSKCASILDSIANFFAVFWSVSRSFPRGFLRSAVASLWKMIPPSPRRGRWWDSRHGGWWWENWMNRIIPNRERVET